MWHKALRQGECGIYRVGILWMQTTACCFLSLQRPVVQVWLAHPWQLSNLIALP